MEPTRFAAFTETALGLWLPVGVFAALPTLGLVTGPAYSSLVFALAAIMFLSRLAQGRTLPAIDGPLAAIAGAFVLLCWASAVWSITPRGSLAAALQMTGIAGAAVVFLALWDAPERIAEPLFRVLLIACVAGVVVVSLDIKLGERLEALASGRPSATALTKYNRGLDYLVLIGWPVLAHAVWRRRWLALGLLGLSLVVAEAVGVSLAGRVALLLGLVTLLLAHVLPRLVSVVLAGCTAAWAAFLPLGLRALASHRAALVPYLKQSGIDRLEIWDFMTARVAERPLLGWGLMSAKSLPVTQAELARYSYVTASSALYPHNQWLELWVELGALGVAAGVALAWLVLARARRLPARARPFAFAAFTSAMTISAVNYELTTDSWLAALAACGALFIILGRAMTHGTAA